MHTELHEHPITKSTAPTEAITVCPERQSCHSSAFESGSWLDMLLLAHTHSALCMKLAVSGIYSILRYQLQLLAFRIDAAATAPRVEWQCRAHLSCAVLAAPSSAVESAPLLPAFSLTDVSPHAVFSLSLACTMSAVCLSVYLQKHLMP